MSEEKVAEHAGNVVQIFKNKSLSWKEKIKKFIEEIIVIVLAISLTLVFHNWNDARHEQKIAKDFLKGIQSDLIRGSGDLEKSIQEFQPTLNYYDTVWAQMNSNTLNIPYVDSLSDYLINTSYFVFDDGRFQGFKSSGYLRLIENQELLNHVVTLYTVYIPFERDADVNVFRTRETDYNTYIGVKALIDSNGVHIGKLLKDPAIRFQIYRYKAYLEERKTHKQWLVKKMREVAIEIGKELGN